MPLAYREWPHPALQQPHTSRHADLDARHAHLACILRTTLYSVVRNMNDPTLLILASLAEGDKYLPEYRCFSKRGSSPRTSLDSKLTQPEPALVLKELESVRSNHVLA